MATELEALKAAVAEAKTVHRAAVKMILEAKRAADAARRKLGEAQRAYYAALPPSKQPKPRPKRVTRADDLFAPSPSREEVA